MQQQQGKVELPMCKGRWMRRMMKAELRGQHSRLARAFLAPDHAPERHRRDSKETSQWHRWTQITDGSICSCEDG